MTWLRSLVSIAAFAFVAAPLEAQLPRVLTKLPAYRNDIALDTLVYATEVIDVPVERAFSLARAALSELKIPRSLADSARGVIGNVRFATSGSMGGERLSRFLHCGVGLSGENADYWRVTLAVVAFVSPVSERTSRVGVAVTGSSQDMGGAYKEPLPCATSGMLEGRIVGRLRELAALR